MRIMARPVEIARAYEALRAQAVGQAPAATPRGLALFLRVGLPGWMPACPPLAATAAPPRAADTPPRTASTEPTAELVRVLAAMALGHRRGCGA